MTDSGLPARPASYSRTELAELMMPQNANILGKVFGGTVLSLIDKAAGTAAIRHAGRVCVTAQIDRVTFDQPIEIGEMARFVAEVTYAGRSSLEVSVCVYALDLHTGAERLTNTCYVIMVSLGDDGKPARVPPLELVTDADRERFAEAEQRMRERRTRRERSRGRQGV